VLKGNKGTGGPARRSERPPAKKGKYDHRKHTCKLPSGGGGKNKDY